MRVYEFVYSSCIHEDSGHTVSIHKTRRGAEMVLEFHKNELKKEWDEMYAYYEPPCEFGYMEDWRVRETEIKE